MQRTTLPLWNMHRSGLADNAPSPETRRADVTATRNRVFILSHFKEISLTGSKGGFVRTINTILEAKSEICGQEAEYVNMPP